MYFCPKCHFTFDVGKIISINNVNETNNNSIKKVADVFKKLENKEDLTNLKADFKFEDLTKNAKYKKLNQEEKNNVAKLFNDTPTTGIEFNCTNCNFTKKIEETILLYQLNMVNNEDKLKTLEENELISKNPILPRTHDYLCKNNMCITNTNNKIKKEAVFLRENNSFKINYICCLCYYSW